MIFVHLWRPPGGERWSVAWVGADDVVEGHHVTSSNWKAVAVRIEAVLAVPSIHVVAIEPANVAMKLSALLSKAGCAEGIRVADANVEEGFRGLQAVTIWLNASLAR